MKENHVSLISSAIYLGDIPREQDGITYVPETVTTANVDLKTESWIPVPFESIVQQTLDSWDAYGLAVALAHPQQFLGEHEEEAWRTYQLATEWMQTNDGTIIQAEPFKPKTNYAFDPFPVIVGLSAAVISTLLMLSLRHKDRKPQQEVQEIFPRDYALVTSSASCHHSD
jgi:hypothetical protein